MSDTSSKFFIFVSGVAIGSFITWKVLEHRYNQPFEEEYYEEETEDTQDSSNDISDSSEKDIRDFASKVTESDYIHYSNPKSIKKEESNVKKPYVIPPEEYGENEQYEQISLTYYADGVLTDDKNEIIDDVDNIVGIDSLSHFGEYEDDSVFVRNDRLKAEYEILLVEREYYEVGNVTPYSGDK